MKNMLYLSCMPWNRKTPYAFVRINELLQDHAVCFIGESGFSLTLQRADVG